MNRIYTKESFSQLDFDDKCTLLEALLTDEFYNGQMEIGFYNSEDFKGEIGENLPETPIEIKNIEDEKFENLIIKLTDKLFETQKEFEFDIEYYNEQVEKSNEIIFSHASLTKE
jgi:hypothetical protein